MPMSQWWKAIRDRIQRALFNQQREVLLILAWSERWMTYIEVSFASRGRVSSDNALTVLYHLRDDMGDEPLVDFAIRREGQVGSYWAINAAGRKWLEDRR